MSTQYTAAWIKYSTVSWRSRQYTSMLRKLWPGLSLIPSSINDNLLKPRHSGCQLWVQQRYEAILRRTRSSYTLEERYKEHYTSKRQRPSAHSHTLMVLTVQIHSAGSGIAHDSRWARVAWRLYCTFLRYLVTRLAAVRTSLFALLISCQTKSVHLWAIETVLVAYIYLETMIKLWDDLNAFLLPTNEVVGFDKHTLIDAPSSWLFSLITRPGALREGSPFLRHPQKEVSWQHPERRLMYCWKGKDTRDSLWSLRVGKDACTCTRGHVDDHWPSIPPCFTQSWLLLPTYFFVLYLRALITKMPNMTRDQIRHEVINLQKTLNLLERSFNEEDWTRCTSKERNNKWLKSQTIIAVSQILCLLWAYIDGPC